MNKRAGQKVQVGGIISGQIDNKLDGVGPVDNSTFLVSGQQPCLLVPMFLECECGSRQVITMDKGEGEKGGSQITNWIKNCISK